MNDELSKLHCQLVAARKSGRAVPRALRLEIAETALLRKKDKRLSLVSFSKELGIVPSTLHGWLDLARSKAKKSENEGGKVRPITLLEKKCTSLSPSITVHLPSGLKVEGVSVADVVAIERALA